MKIAAAYIRVSTDDQTEYSPDAQIRAIRSWASAHGYIVPDEYVFADEGISGRRAEKRPAFMRMIGTAKVKPRPFDAILVHKFDRFARSREDSVVYKSMLRRNCGVQVISITESIDDDKFSVILEAMLEAMAEYYSINLAGEVRKGMTEKARRGERQTPPPYGYRSVNGSMQPEPGESEIVRELYRRFAGGASYFSLARWLNTAGMRTRKGKPFQNRTIRYILTNPTYIGKNCWTPEQKCDSSTGYVITEDTIIADASHEPLIDTQLWDSVQTRVEKLKQTFGHNAKPSAHADWPSGLVRCPHCGSIMARNLQGKYADGRPKVYWLCNGYAHGKCTHTNNCTDAQLKSAIVAALRALCSDTDRLASMVQTSVRKAADPYPAMLARLDQQLQRAKEAYQSGIDTLEEYAEAKRQIVQAKAQLEHERHSDAISPAQSKKAIGQLIDTIRSTAALLESDAPMEEKHHSAHELIERMIFDRESNTAHILLKANIIAIIS